MPDLSSYSIRIIECGACHQPLSSARDAFDVSPCSYCGAEPQQTRAQATAAVAQAPTAYRERPRDERGRLLQFDLTQPPDDCASWAKSVRPRDLPALRAKWEDVKARLLGSGDKTSKIAARTSLEFRATWLALTLAALYGLMADPIRERAVLETALDLVRSPSYRAMVVARLSWSAASASALDVASAWLEGAHSTGILEADSDLIVARAVLANAQSDHAKALELVGPSLHASRLAGPSRVLAALVRADALEKQGANSEAYVQYRAALQAFGNARLAAFQWRFKLAPLARRKTVRVGMVALVGILVVLGGAGWVLSRSLETQLLAIVVLAVVVVVLWLRRIRLHRA